MTDDETENHDANVKVFVRILPLEKLYESCARIDTERKTIYVRCSQDMNVKRIVTPKDPCYWCFRTDGIFYDSSQEEIYCSTTKDLLHKALEGVDCVLICYGQTGSGKSFTISGPKNIREHRGLVLRLVNDMFAEKSSRKKVSRINYRFSFVEVRGKEAKDLLTLKNNVIKVNERDAFKNVNIKRIENEEDALKLIFEAENRRSIAKGSTYPVSHLGTALLTFHVWNTSLITSLAVVATAKIHIVELAGIDTVGKSVCQKTAHDVGSANLDKMQLERFFSCLRTAGISSANSVIRSNNLLKFLKNALRVTSVIRFIAHVRIAKEDLDITLSTLRFAAKISKLRPIKTEPHFESSSEMIIQRLQEEVEKLKKELDINAMFSQQETLINISKLRAEQISRDILNFLNGSISDLTLIDVSQARVLLKMIKELYKKLIARQLEVENLGSTYETLSKNAPRSAPVDSLSKSDGAITNVTRTTSAIERKQEVGDLDKSGITLGPNETAENETTVKIFKHPKIPKGILAINDPNTSQYHNKIV